MQWVFLEVKAEFKNLLGELRPLNFTSYLMLQSRPS
jgi:hypothetical protein